GPANAKEVLERANIDPSTRAKDLTEQQLSQIVHAIQDGKYVIEGDLRREIGLNLKRLQAISATGASATCAACRFAASAPAPMLARARARGRPSACNAIPRPRPAFIDRTTLTSLLSPPWLTSRNPKTRNRRIKPSLPPRSPKRPRHPANLPPMPRVPRRPLRPLPESQPPRLPGLPRRPSRPLLLPLRPSCLATTRRPRRSSRPKARRTSSRVLPTFSQPSTTPRFPSAICTAT